MPNSKCGHIKKKIHNLIYFLKRMIMSAHHIHIITYYILLCWTTINKSLLFTIYKIYSVLLILLELIELTFRPTNHSIRKGGTGENQNDVTPLNFITGSILYAIFSTANGYTCLEKLTTEKCKQQAKQPEKKY